MNLAAYGMFSRAQALFDLDRGAYDRAERLAAMLVNSAEIRDDFAEFRRSPHSRRCACAAATRA